MASPSRHLSISIARPAGEVYAYAADPMNLPHWAAGLARSTIERVDGAWAADSPMGRVTVRFAEHNSFGVLDDVVTLPSGEEVYNPMRVIPDAASCEVVFTLRRGAAMSDREWADDADAVRADLRTLKRILETP